MIVVDGKEVSLELIGQNFTDPMFFRGRVSSVNYNTYTEGDTRPNKEGKTTYSGSAARGHKIWHLLIKNFKKELQRI